MLALLKPLFQGEWAGMGEAFTCPPHPALPPGGRRMPLAFWMADPAGLLRLHGTHLGIALQDADLRPAASAWSLDYLWLLLPASVAAASMLDHGWPSDPSQTWMDVDACGAPVRLHLPHGGLPLQTDAGAHLQRLVMGHVAPLWHALHRDGRVPLKTLWANTRRVLEAIFDALAGLAGDDPGLSQRIARGRHALLDTATWADASGSAQADGRSAAQANPLHIRHDRRLAGPDGMARHAQCCLRHLLPGQHACGLCPLTCPSAASTGIVGIASTAQAVSPRTSKAPRGSPC